MHCYKIIIKLQKLKFVIVGVTDRGAHTNIHVGLRPSPRKNPSLAMGRIPHWPYLAEDKGNGLSLRVALRITPWNRKSTKTEKNNGKNRNI